ncbi:MAG: HAD family hydrolase [Spirochaetales bacterium]
MKLKVVAFDVDGTLYPNSRMYFYSIPFGLSHAKELLAFGRVRKQLRSLRPIYNFYQVQAELFAGRLNIPTDKAAALIKNLFYTQWEEVILDIKPYPYIQEVLFHLKSLKLGLAVLSDFPIGNKLKYLGLDGIWDAAYSCEEIGYLKPNPEPFRVLLAHFAVQPHEVLYVGNNYTYDIEGAKRIGFYTAFLNRWRRKCPAADFVFSDYRKLLQWVASNHD